MSTAAAVLYGHELTGVADVAKQLVPLFGEKGQALFCVGLFSAAYSSFLVNSMIGGFILSDGLGLGSKPTDMAPKVLTTAVLLTGMAVALFVVLGSLPGQIAKKRGHPNAKAIQIGGWATLLLAVVGWPFVLMWAMSESSPKLDPEKTNSNDQDFNQRKRSISPG